MDVAVHVRDIANRLGRLPYGCERGDMVAAGMVGALRAGEVSSICLRMRIRGAMLDEMRRWRWGPRGRRVVMVYTEVERASERTPLDAYISKHDSARALSHLDALPAPLADVMRRRYLRGEAPHLTARARGVSRSAICQQHARACRILRALMEAEGCPSSSST